MARECGWWDPGKIFVPLKSERVKTAKTISLIIREMLAYGERRTSMPCNGHVTVTRAD
jgi:hypothetical protein